MKKILVAEDDQFLVKVYESKLTKEGYEIKIAKDGEEVEEVLKTFTPDLILLDLIMPKKDGFEVLKYIKSKENLKNIPVIVTSNLGQGEDKEKALSFGASEYVIKSDVSIKNVIERIESYIKK